MAAQVSFSSKIVNVRGDNRARHASLDKAVVGYVDQEVWGLEFRFREFRA